MASSIAMPRNGGTPDSMVRVFLYSIGAHLLVLMVIPLTIRLFMQHRQFTRPPTFQLVSLSKPAPLQPQKIAEQKVVQQEKKVVKDAVKPMPSQSKTEKAKSEENVDELADLLDAISQPAVDVSPVAPNFKYPWYINNIRMKVEENWKPPVENAEIYVEVTFTIFRSGDISDITVTHSSGTPSLDNVGIRAIKLAAPFGKLPVGFSEDKLEVSYTLRPVRK